MVNNEKVLAATRAHVTRLLRADVTRLLRAGAGVSVRLSPSQRTWYTEPVWRDDSAERIEVGQRAANWDDWDARLWKYQAGA